MKRISVVGGGPGGLYFAYLWKSRHPEDSVTVFEQNAPAMHLASVRVLRPGDGLLARR